MLISYSTATRETGTRRSLIIGLSDLNLYHLRNDEPIKRPLDGDGQDGPTIPGLDGWDLIILGPEDMARFVAAMGRTMPDEERLPE